MNSLVELMNFSEELIPRAQIRMKEVGLLNVNT